MANTYTQLYIQFIFCPKYRAAIIDSGWEGRLHKYLAAIVQNHQHKLIAVNGMPDHVHLFVGMKPGQSPSDLMRIVKGDSSEWINKEKFTTVKFNWQEGFGAFSYSAWDVDKIYKYVMNQKEHHQQQSFFEEYEEFLKAFGIDYDRRYTFKEPE
jgi:putative transposase